MFIDIHTLVVVLGGATILQVFALLFQYLLNRSQSGPVWWLLWSISAAAESLLLILTDMMGWEQLHASLISSHIIVLIGQVLLYIGILRFLGRRESLKIILISFVMIILATASAISVSWTYKSGFLILNGTVAFVSFVNAYSLVVRKRLSINASGIFLAAVFAFHGGYFVLQSILVLGNSPQFLAMVGVPNLFVMLTTNTLWAFGLIVMFNQSLIAENRESRENLETIINTSPDAITVTRVSDGRYVDVNKAFMDMSGYSRAEALEKSTVDLNIWRDPAQRLQIAEILAKKGACEYVEVWFRRKDESIFEALLFSKIISLQGVPHIISVVHDITNLKRNEAQLRRLNTVVEQSQVSVMITDPHGTIEYVNPRFCVTTGYSEADVIGRNPNFLRSDDMPANTYRELWETILNGHTWHGRFHNRRKDGSLFWESAIISPIVNERGEITSFAAVKQDITEQIQAEAALLKLTAVEERQRLARDLHDSVNQSIHGMVLFSETLVSTLEKQNVERARQIAERLQESARQALKETRLMLYQLQPSGTENQIDLVRDLETRLLMVERHAGLRAQIIQEGSIEYCPIAWQENLFWITIEALNNALKHAQARNVQILIRCLPGHMDLEISDDGIGFDPSRPRNGGLGLQNMKDRARILGGAVTVQSRDRHGTRVIFNADILEE